MTEMVNWFSSRLNILWCDGNGDKDGKISTVMGIKMGFFVGMRWGNSSENGMGMREI